MLSSLMTSDPKFTNLVADYNIEITITPKGSLPIAPDKVSIIDKVLSSLKINNKELRDAKKKKVAVKNIMSKKTSTFELDVNDVMPRIYLEGRISIDVNGTPNLTELKTFCDDLLEELTLEEYTRIIRNP